MTTDITRIGLVGTGFISNQYAGMIDRLPELRIVGVADAQASRAEAFATRLGIRADPVPDLLAREDVDVILNLTTPAAHAEIALAALRAGKHVYGEKPLASTSAQAQTMLEEAERRHLRLGAAPDTVLGTGIQSARAALDQGRIGEPIGATAFWGAPGHELWHPAPDFYYQRGGGPLLDMGPYYVTALVTLLGPIVRVSGMTRQNSRERRIVTGQRAGERVDVDTTVPTHTAALLRHESGAVSTLVCSFDVHATRNSNIEVYGAEGAMLVPDPNEFTLRGAVSRAGESDWTELPDTAGYRAAARGVGLDDMARAIAEGGSHRATGELALHVLEVLEAVQLSSSEETSIAIASRPQRPAAIPSIRG